VDADGVEVRIECAFEQSPRRGRDPLTIAGSAADTRFNLDNNIGWDAWGR